MAHPSSSAHTVTASEARAAPGSARPGMARRARLAWRGLRCRRRAPCAGLSARPTLPPVDIACYNCIKRAGLRCNPVRPRLTSPARTPVLLRRRLHFQRGDLQRQHAHRLGQLLIAPSPRFGHGHCSTHPPPRPPSASHPAQRPSCPEPGTRARHRSHRRLDSRLDRALEAVRELGARHVARAHLAGQRQGVQRHAVGVDARLDDGVFCASAFVMPCASIAHFRNRLLA